MNNFTNAVDIIKSRVTIPEVISFYLPGESPRKNRIPCPIHGGKNYNFSFTDDVFYCFVCGAGGDVITFVQMFFELEFTAAVARLNSDFALGIPLDRRMTLREKREAERRRREMLARREIKEAKEKEYNELYWNLWDEWIRLDKNRMAYAPKSPEEKLHPLFKEAICKIEHQRFLIDALL